MPLPNINPNNDSILISIKKLLGVDSEYLVFDQDIIMYINTVFMILHQMGIDTFEKPFFITDSYSTWDDYLEGDTRIQGIKTYVYMKVRTMFDPPQGAAKEALEGAIQELEYRLYQEKEYAENVVE